MNMPIPIVEHGAEVPEPKVMIMQMPHAGKVIGEDHGVTLEGDLTFECRDTYHEVWILWYQPAVLGVRHRHELSP